MQFRTELQFNKPPFQLHYTDKVLSIGSCFADNLGAKLAAHGWHIQTNPLGIIFNPLSLHQTLYRPPSHFNSLQSCVLSGELWYHEDFHSRWSDFSAESLLNTLIPNIEKMQIMVEKAQVLILTWGTAWVYARRDNGHIVANCHKQNAKNFEKKLLSTEVIIQSFEQLYQYIQQKNPTIKVILTISPVRHIKDTLELNSISKATLLLAKHQILQKYPQMAYFPSYELLLDDLRDYRFYASDLLHPSEEAITYIWQKWQKYYLDELSQQYVLDYAHLVKQIQHLPHNTRTRAYQLFCEKLAAQTQAFEQKYKVQVFK